uniref:Secreted protein n=1 Tax=Angiostrongylus cantonensis TaxID=6313 RepID=A0A0K0DEN0_ANGCA
MKVVMMMTMAMMMMMMMVNNEEVPDIVKTKAVVNYESMIGREEVGAHRGSKPMDSEKCSSTTQPAESFSLANEFRPQAQILLFNGIVA